MNEILRCVNLTKAYGPKVALDRMSLSIYSGRIVGLLGPNGSGKTTFLKMAAGMMIPSAGDIFIDGFRPGVETKSVVSYLPDHLYVPDWMRVRDLEEYYQDFFADFDRRRADEMLGLLGIDNRWVLKQLSKGNKEKVQLIMTMSRRAKLYLLDEPIAGVDPAARDYILRTIVNNYEPNSTIVLSTHLISDIERILDDVIFIRDGHIIRYGCVEDLRKATGTSIDHLFREEFRC
ncbi:MAG: ABC transporter ATP-binding protein [Eubacterium sp.]|nr:ABC transporter ATP-binding protein [Eubacterium sp.]